MDLREWAVVYVKNKDMLKRNLVSHKEEADKIIFTFKDHVMNAFAMEKLSAPKIDGKTFIFTLHTKENVDFLLKHWSDFCKHKDLTIIFANPKKNEKWLIHPHTHESISDGKIETGIAAMANEVSWV